MNILIWCTPTRHRTWEEWAVITKWMTCCFVSCQEAMSSSRCQWAGFESGTVSHKYHLHVDQHVSPHARIGLSQGREKYPWIKC
eukprot:2764326-Amphidinium_carterae.1